MKEEQFFQIYILSNKKQRYWLSLFFILCSLFFLLIYNNKLWDTLPNYSRNKSNLTKLIKFHDTLDVPEEYNLCLGPLHFNRPQIWSNRHQDLKKYLAKRKKFCDAMRRISHNELNQEIMDYMVRDSVAIVKCMQKHNEVISRIPNSKGNTQKDKFHKEINDTLRKIYDDIIKDKYLEILCRRYPDFRAVKNSSMKAVQEGLRDKITTVDQFLESEPLNLPNFQIPLRLNLVINIGFLVLYFLGFYSQLLFLHVQYLKRHYNNIELINLYFPSLLNALKVLGVQIRLLRIFYFIFNVVILNIVLFTITYFLFGVLNKWFACGVIAFYVIFLVSLYKKSLVRRLIKV